MKIVVTGAAGHIGSKLTAELRSAQRMIPLDIRNAAAEDIRTFPLASLLDPGDRVIHLAALTNAEESLSRSGEYFSVNAQGTEIVARACANKGAALIFPSTTSVFGAFSGDLDEDATLDELRPQHPYAASKLEAEKILDRLGREKGLRFVTLRFGTIFGASPGMSFHTVVQKLCRQAFDGESLSIWRTALHQERPYLYLGDAVRAILFALQHDFFPNAACHAATVNAELSSVLDSIKKCVPDLSWKEIDSPLMNQAFHRILPGRLQRAGFQTQGSLEQGVREVLEELEVRARIGSAA